MGALVIIGVLFIAVIPLIMLAMLSSIKSRQREDNAALMKRLERLEEVIVSLKYRGTEREDLFTPPPPAVTAPEPPPTVVNETVNPPQPVSPPLVYEPVNEPPPPPVEQPIPKAEHIPAPDPQQFLRRPENKAPKSTKDFERFIGENLAGKIGIAVLVLGIGYFVKYAIDRDLINEFGRVALGLISGCILLGIAHWQRKSYRAFSSLLVAGGIATFYFTITIAFQQYKMFGQVPAFVIMVVITAFSVLLSVLYDRRELAALSLLGGLGAPFMVSTGQGNYVVLFTYLLILDAGMLALAYMRKWSIINVLSFAGTVLLYGAWFVSDVIGNPAPPYAGAFLFASLFYAVFFVMNIIPQLRRNEPFTPFQTTLLLLITFLYFTAGMSILHLWEQKEYRGIFTALLAVFNFIFGILFYRSPAADRRLVLYLFGLVLVFVSLVAPVQLKGNYITLFWAAEAAMLLWFSRPAKMPLAKTASLLLVGLMMASLVIDWFKVYGFGAAHLPVIANKMFITCVACFASLAISRRLLRNDTANYQLGVGYIENSSAGIFFDILMAIVALGTLNFEGLYQMNRLEYSDSLRQIVIMGINYGWVLALLLIVIIRRSKGFAPFVMGLGILALILNCLSQWVYFRLFREAMEGSPLQPGFVLHYINVVLLAGILAALFILAKKQGQAGSPLLQWAGTFFAVFLLSTELSLHALYANTDSLISIAGGDYAAGLAEYRAILIQIAKSGYPVLWGLCSFGLMWLGMRKKIQTLRIISLTLFTLTLAKLFIFDIRGISEGGRIAAFIILGILLLVVSFMYQKIKKIILDNEEKGN